MQLLTSAIVVQLWRRRRTLTVNEMSWQQAIGLKLWYVFLSAISSTVAGAVGLGVYLIIYGRATMGTLADTFGVILITAFVVGLLVSASALLIAFPVYLIVLPPRSMLYGALIGLGSGAAIMLVCTILFGSFRGSAAIRYFVGDTAGLILWAGVCGAVFMGVLARLTNRRLRSFSVD